MQAPRIRRFQADFKEALVDRLREGITKDLEAWGAGKDLCYSLVAVMDELCCNVLEHAGAHWVELESSFSDGKLNLVLRDDGAAFDPSKAVANTEVDMEKVEDRNLGLYVVGKLTDAFKYTRLPEGINETSVSVRLA